MALGLVPLRLEEQPQGLQALSLPRKCAGGPYSLRTKRVEDLSGEAQLRVPGAECTSSSELCAGSLGPTFPAE